MVSEYQWSVTGLRGRSAGWKSRCRSPASFERREIKKLICCLLIGYSLRYIPPSQVVKKKEKKKTQQGTPRFYLSLIYAAFSNCAIPAGVTALWRNLGAILPAWVCQKPICMRPANVLEIKAPTCQVNSLHLYEAVKLFHLPLSREIKGPPREGCPRTKAKDAAPCLGV